MTRMGLWRSAVLSSLLGVSGICAGGVAQAQAVAEPAGPAAADAEYVQAGQYRVGIERGVWLDTSRDREVPWLIRYPSDAAGPRPVLLFSHGLGGSREGLARLSAFLASHGYVVVHVQHKGSDTAIWNGVRPDLKTVDRSALLKVASDRSVLLNRFADIPFALEQLHDMAETGPMAGRLDMDRVAMSGHSFGAVTTQVAAGQVFAGGVSMPVDGFRAFIAMSPSGDRNGNDKQAFANVSEPFLMMTGTQDSFALNPSVSAASDRLRPYRALPATLPAVLVNLVGGDHFAFSGGILTDEPRPKDPRYHEIIDATVLAFLDAFLMDDAGAREWLENDLPGFAGSDAEIEMRNIVE